MTRALVLSGGGSVGIAWQSGLLAGLAQTGVDLGTADLTLGTSAGAFVGARLAMSSERATFADAIIAAPAAPAASADGAGADRPPEVSELLARIIGMQGPSREPNDARAALGAFALAARTMSEDEFIATFGRSFANLPADAWPERNFACTAVDALTGGFRLWTKDSGVGIARAVASSCSVPGTYPAMTLNGRRYTDGALRSFTNADLATGHDLVVVVSIDAVQEPALLEAIDQHLEQEIRALEDGGAKVVTVKPDEASLEACGLNLLDFRRRPDAARAGIAQGLALADALKPHWVIPVGVRVGAEDIEARGG